MKRVLKKFIAVICLVSVVSTAFVFPLVSTPVTVHAEPVGISMGLFEQVFGSLAGSFGMKSRSDSKYYGFPSVEELWNSFKQTYEMVRATKPEMLALTVDAWACSNLKDFIAGAIKVFPFFIQDYKDGRFDGVMGDLSTVENFKTLFNSDQKILYDSSYDGLQYRYNIRNTKECASQNNYIEGISNERSLECFNSTYGVHSNYYIWGTHSNGVVTFYPIVPGTHSFIYVSSTSLSFFNDTDEIYCSDYSGRPDSISFTLKKFEYKFDFSKFRFNNFYTNMSIRVFEDGSALIYDPTILDLGSFDTIEGSVWDEMQKSGTNIDDWELADENGKTIDDPESKILEKIYKNMLTADDIEALRNGDTSVLDKLQGMTAVNSKTGETVGDIKDEVQDQTGILGGIKAIGRTIASRVLTIVNLIRNLHQRKWTSVIDNVGDLTLPVIKSIDGVRDVVNALQATKWVIDNVGDLVNPITTSIDMVNGNLAGVISNIGNSILGAIDDIQTADLTSVVDGIKAVPKSIAQSLESAFEGVKSSVGAVSVAIGNLFAPPPVALSNIYTKGSDILDNHFCMPKAAFKTFMVEGKEVPDVKYKVGGKEYTVIPFSYFNKFVDKFRGYIQASFIFIWIVWFANQVLALFDKSAILSGHITDLGRGER